ncbi:MAG: LptF/LptG family permease [Candidatus Omnitrophica bacterium]|nr:LptF/LptG family permease [Candidatus Omnitrophota bacterium]MBU1851971.1 LptF/LptG family permease [Candidatus Omnitrophota bacterium]
MGDRNVAENFTALAQSMRIINRYLLKELAGPFFASLFVSTFILAAGNIMQTADMIMNKGVEIGYVVKIFLLFLPYVLIFTIPISVLSAVLLGFGRLSSDNEVTALRTSGISLRKMIFPVIICGFIVSLISIPLNDKILPQSEFAARKLIKKIGMKHPTALLEPGVFVKGFKNYVVFIHGVKGDILQDIRIYQPREDGPTRTIVAKRGEIIPLPDENRVKLKLEDGMADEVIADRPDEFYKLSFQEYHMTLDLDETVDVNSIGKKAREKSIKELLADIEEMRDMKDIKGGDIPLRIEMHKKLAIAFSNLVFVLMGIPLAITTHRREKFIGFALAMALFLLYWGFMLGGIAFAIRGVIPPWAGVWSADIVLFIVGSVMLCKVTVR